MLSDNTAHVFVVSAPLDVQSNPGECSITEGDVLRLTPGARPDASTATLIVLASKGQDCQRGATVTVGVADPQEMQNHMRETLDQGLADLQKKQGQNGIPAAPAAATAPPVQTAFAATAPPPDPNVATELSAQTKEADRADQGPQAAAPSTAPASPNPLTVGQTLDEVIAILGQPINIVDAGTKKIYVFKDLKVTFTNGKAGAFQ
jgi:TolA-binding protein